jgi:IS5 family transposase
MRIKLDAQEAFDFYQNQSKLSEKLEKVSEILDRDRSFLDKIAEDFKTEKCSNAGAKGMTIEQIVRTAIIKQMYGLSYNRLCDELNDNISYRKFTKFYNNKVPKVSTLNENIKRISVEGWEEISKIIVKVAIELEIETGRSVRMDSTGVESNIHFPSDGELLWDCVRVLSRIMETVREEYSEMKFEYHSHQSRAKKRRFNIMNTNKEEKRKESYKDLIKVSKETQGYAKECVKELGKYVEAWDIEAKIYKEELEGYLDSLEIIIKQTERRVLKDEKVESKDKLVSIFETHTDILVKGKRETVFGHKILLSGGKSNMILDCVIERGNWSDTEAFSKGIDRVEEKYGKIPEEIATDGGFSSKSNYEYAKEKGIKDILFTKKGTVKMIELVKTNRVYKKLKRFRAGIEGSISAMKRACGLDRCTWKSWRSFQSYVWLSVIVFNLNILAAKL